MDNFSGALPAAYFAIRAFMRQRSEIEALKQRQQAQDDLLTRQLNREERMAAAPVKVVVSAASAVDSENHARPPRQLFVRILNQSDRTIFHVDCRILFEHNVVPPQKGRYCLLEHGVNGQYWRSTTTVERPVASVGPDQGVQFTHAVDDDHSQDGVMVEVRFTDEFDTHWSRSRDGLLVKLASREW